MRVASSGSAAGADSSSGGWTGASARSSTLAPVSDPIPGGGAKARALVARVLPRPVKRLLKRSVPALGPRGTARAARGVGAPGGSATSHVPTDHARQVHSRYYIEEAMTATDAPPLVVDLGCGSGGS